MSPGTVLAFLVVCLFLVAVIWMAQLSGGASRSEGISKLFGDASFFKIYDCEEQKLIRQEKNGIPLGFFSEWKAIGGRKEITEVVHPLHYAGGRHLITVAPTRTGKGASVQVPVLLEYNASIMMIDPKGENAAITAKHRYDAMRQYVYIVNPFGVLGDTFAGLGFEKPARFNPLAALDPESDTYVSEVAAICEALIIADGKDSHWSNSARDLVAARILWACQFGKPEEKTLPSIRDFLTAKGDDFRGMVADMAACGDVVIQNKAMRFLDSRNELDGIISTAITQTAFLDDPCLRESLSGDDFRFLDLKRRKMTVYLVLPAKLMPPYARWFRLLVVSALDAMMSSEEKGDKPVLLMLDEFASLGHLSSVENAMGLAAGFGLQIWPFVQDIHQLEDIYSRRWKSFLANAGVQQYFTPNDMDTADFISKRAGNKTVKTRTINLQSLTNSQVKDGATGEGRSISETARPLMDGLEILDLKNDKAIAFLAGCKKTLLYNRYNYYENEKYKGLWSPNPYFKKALASVEDSQDYWR